MRGSAGSDGQLLLLEPKVGVTRHKVRRAKGDMDKQLTNQSQPHIRLIVRKTVTMKNTNTMTATFNLKLNGI